MSECPETQPSDGITSNYILQTPCAIIQQSPRRRSNRTRPCGRCTDACIYNVIDSCFIIGVLANVFVILRVIRDRKLRNPTFVAIASLAVADLLFLSLNITRSIEMVARTVSCTFPATLRGGMVGTIMNISWFSANGHVALMAILRYIMLAYPLRSSYFLTNKKVLVFSGCVWILGCILIGVLTLMIQLDVVNRYRSEEFLIYVWSVVYLLPLCVTATLHIVKMRVLRSATKHDAATSETRQSVQRMSRIIALVIFFAAVLPFPRLLYKILRIAKYEFPSQQFKTHFREFSQIVFLSNNFINPFLYAFLSKTFRKSIIRMFNWRRGSASSSSEHVEKCSPRRRTTEQEHIAISLESIK